ncbi:hypothetical protein KR032_002595, partial [Drosophila birchii]
LSISLFADSFIEGDLVFAKAKGYIAWPGIIVAKQRLYSTVTFLGSDDTRRIENAKIWPYSESSKSKFITQKYLDFLEFREAILIAENLSNNVKGNKENGAYCYRLLNKIDLHEQHGEEIEIQGEARQEEVGPKEASQEKSNEKDPGKEEACKKEYGKKEAEMMITYLKGLRSDQDSLNGGVEKKFIELVNNLRHSLRTNQKDYPAALLTLHELHEMTFSELLLVRNFEAVNSIYHVCYLDTAHRNYNEANQVKLLAKQLITHFASVIRMSDTIGHFMDHFRLLSSIYSRFIYEFEPLQRQSSKEEYGNENVA